MNIHIGLNVTNLKEALSFYSTLFNTEPVKLKENYVKFAIRDLNLNFTLNLRDDVKGNQVNHFGIQVDRLEDIEEQRIRLEQLGFTTYREENTICCYARQEKFWVIDPDENEWEFFFTLEDVEQQQIQTDLCCTNKEKG